MIKVRELKPSGKKRYSYKDVVHAENGWVNARLYLPADYDLMAVKVKGRNSILSGWCVGRNWEGGTLENQDEVLFWKKPAVDRVESDKHLMKI